MLQKYIFLILILKIFLVSIFSIWTLSFSLFLLSLFSAISCKVFYFQELILLVIKQKSHSSYKGFNRYKIDFNSIYKDVFTLGLSHFQ